MARAIAVLGLYHMAVCWSFAADSAQDSLAWKSEDPIVAADFDRYFPDDAEAAELLRLVPRRRLNNGDPLEFVRMIRQGLRRADVRIGREWVEWLGKELIWGSPDGSPNPQAVEVAYHASARPEYEHSALYFGLSRVSSKTPALIRRMVEIALGSEDWINVIGHVAWALSENREPAVACLGSYLASTDPKVREHAEVLRGIFAGELTAHEHWKLVKTREAMDEFGAQMESLRTRLMEGDSQARREVLRTMQRHSLWLIMDDSWADTFRVVATDADPRVRRDVTIEVGTRWAWHAKDVAAVNDRALELLLDLSRDSDPEVRDTVRYYGLSRLPGNEVAENRMRQMDVEDAERKLGQLRAGVRMALEQRRYGDVEGLLHELRPGLNGAEPLKQLIADFVAEVETDLKLARRPSTDLQKQIDALPEGAVVDLPEGVVSGPIILDRRMTIRGAGMNRTIIECAADSPAVMIRDANGVRLESLSVCWSPASTNAEIREPAAVAVRNANVTLERVHLEPIHESIRTPYGLMASGRSDVQFLSGRSRGFAYALIWFDGASGKVMDSDLRGAGHSVVTIHPDCRVEVAGNLLAECGYHAVRVTGGTVDMHDNIVTGCERAGVYLGNKDAHGRIHNNLFVSNHGEIWSYYGSDAVIEHNLFYHSDDPALIFWNTCALVARFNSFVQNPAAIRQFIREEDVSKVGVRLERNHYWRNAEEVQAGHLIGKDSGADARFQVPQSDDAVRGDPKFLDPESGDFTPGEGSALLRDGKVLAGLTSPGVIRDLVRRYQVPVPGLK